ncbi:T9SS type B sorting domain-containing protein [Capnocytophaga sp.]|uniref:T9SS type B sorting domain-containing protein n=1 Tax=Capnocytophaga sp. TaxID=44737 RepID=UPI0026DC535C|nr:T9SS type B sorting domain-containing protein [Capnocytophaga sp.]MDO5104425.1 T9SS type B sorting domain-containing protein [Capnocytophaga sp.]
MKRAVFILYATLLVLATGELFAQRSPNYVPFGVRHQETVKGDMLLVGNSILNVNDRNHGHTNPNLPYTGRHGHNAAVNLDYIDIDKDGTTFNSSSARIQSPNPRSSCLRVKKAYLYWSAAYTQERIKNQQNPRFERSKFGQVKFKTPNATTYQNLTGIQVYDGYDILTLSAGWPQESGQRAYVYLADVTSLLEAEAARRNGAFDGEYTVANIMAPKGREDSGVGYAAGWNLIVVYEDQTRESRHITIFDGFSVINRNNTNVNIDVTGFQTVPTGPVNATFAFAALEGELGISGDGLRMTNPRTRFSTQMSDRERPQNNFFNSKITGLTGANTNRNPSSTNLLGFDAGILNVPNNAKRLIPNGASSIRISPSTVTDSYYPFMFAFNVEVIAPVINLEKKVFRVDSGTDVTGGSVNLGNRLRYEIKFRNSGNDDARDLVLTDKLPKNLLFENINSIKLSWKSNPVRNTDYEYNETTNELKFKIPNNIVKKGQTDWQTVSFEMKVPDHCDDLRDACSNVIANIVHAKYFGVQNTSRDGFTAESVTSHKDCEGNLTGPSTFIADLGTCVSKAKETLCEKTLTLTAGANFDTYAWTRNGQPVPGGNAQTLTVTESGVYRVLKKKAGCADMVEEIDVKLHDEALKSNPIEPYASEVVICPNDGTKYPQIYLCGTADSRQIHLNVTQALSYKWERRNESCNVPPAHSINCPVRDNYGCTWSQVHNGNSYTASQPGDYRVEITYQGGCVALFYFKVSKTQLTPALNVRDIICNTQGSITVTHPAAGYQYALQSSAGTIVRPYQDSNVFANITNTDSYTVLMRQKLAAGATYTACVFQAPASIIKKNPRITVTTTPLACANTKGTIRVQVIDAYPQYTYTIRRDNATGAVVASQPASNDSDVTFTGIDNGTYYIEVQTPDGCRMTDTKVVDKIPDLQARVTVKSHLMCNGEGIVRVDAFGGTPGTSYSYSIDGGATYQQNYTGHFYEFTVSNPGRYTIKVVDANNCEVTVVSDPVRAATPPTFDVVEKLTDCGTKGTIEFINVTNPDGYQIKYSIDGGTTSQLGPKFIGLTPETTYTPTLIYSNGSVDCTISKTITLPPSAAGRVIASAGVSELIGCGTGTNADKARVRITNVRGGTEPYQYSFDGGTTWGSVREMWLLPGTYTVIVRDAVDCEFRTQVVVDPRPVNPVFTSTVTYNCDGTGNISIGSNQSTYTYTYEIGGVETTTSTFSNLPPGQHTIKIKYADPTTPIRHELFIEDFGAGTTNVRTPYINSKYYFEPLTRNATLYPDDLKLHTDGRTYRIINGLGQLQPNSVTLPPPVGNVSFDPASTRLNDGEYVVSRGLGSQNNPAWTQPTDHTGLTNGRMLFVNVGNILGTEGAILYQRKMIDVEPNQPIQFSIAAMNLINTRGSNPRAADPDLTIELYTSEAAIAANTPLISQPIGTLVAGSTPPRYVIPKSTNVSDWYTYQYPLNPGNNTELYAVIRSGSLVTNGNDVAIDDIYLYQLPKICSFDETLTVTIENDKAFDVLPNTQRVTDILCNDANNGTYQIALKNTDPAGYWVSKDGGPFVRETANPFVWNNIAGGTHNVVFRFGQTTTHCEKTRTFTVNNPSQITIQPINDVVLGCNPASVGLTFMASGGVGALRFELKQPDGTVLAQNTPNFTITQAGTHELTATDANNCSSKVQFNVTQAPIPTISVANTSSYCVTPGTPAKLDVTVANGTAPFTFSINGNVQAPTNNASFSFGNLQPGTYTIKVVDKYGCEGTLTETIQPELRVQSATVEKDITCDTPPTNEGSIKVLVAGGYTPYKYTLKMGTTVVMPETALVGNEITYKSANAGVYTIEITDAKGCKTSVDRELTAPQNPDFTTTKVDVKCFGESTGSITVNVTGGTPPYRYFVNGTDRGSQNQYNNLPAGNYTIIVRDAKNCEVTKQVLIEQPAAALAITTTFKKLISCDPASDMAEVEYTVTGGTPAYNDNQGGTNYQSNVPRTIKLGVGTHNITVTDANGCQVQETIVVPARPTPPTVNANPAITYNCDGTGNFTITATPNTYDYTYTLGTETNNTGAFANVAVGTHQVVIQYKEKNPVQGAEDCGYTMTVTITVAPGQEFKANLASVTGVSCNGQSDAQAIINVENFGAGYSYKVDTGASQNANTPTITIPNLSAGLHTVTLTYATCTLEVPITVTQPDALTATGTITVPAKCSNNRLATVTLQAQGGTPPYSYKFGTFPPQQTNVFTQVPVGAQTFTITDKNNCSVSVTVDVAAPKQVVFTAVPTACYSGNNDAEIVVTVTDGNGDYRFSINNGAWQTPSATSSMTYTFTGLSASTGAGYTIRVEDAFGCADVKQVVIHPKLVVTTKETSVSCNAGKIEVTATGGDGAYEFDIVPAGTAPTYTAGASPYSENVTAAGAYDVYVKSAACVYSTTVTVAQAPAIAFTVTPKDPSCHGYTGNIAITNIVGDGPYTLNLYEQGVTAPITSVPNYINKTYDFSNLAPGKTYDVAIADRYGCVHTETVMITDKPQLTATITLGTTGCVVFGQTVTLTLTVSQNLIDAYTALGYKVQYSVDGGASWADVTTAQTIINGKKVGDTFTPSLRVVDTASGVICLTTLPRYTVPFPLSELAVATDLITGFTGTCTPGGFTVEVTATGGIPPYTFTMEDPHNPATVWHSSNVPGSTNKYRFTGLTPGRTYIFYVKDSKGCIQQNEKDIYEGYVPPMKVDAEVTPICFGATHGTITFVVKRSANSTSVATHFDWKVIDKATGNVVPGTGFTGNSPMPPKPGDIRIAVPNLPVGTYYMEIEEQGTACKWASLDTQMYVQTELQGTPIVKRGITCTIPGVIEIQNPHGGGGTYTFELTSAAFVAPITTNNTTIEINSNNLNTTASPISVQIKMTDQHGCDKVLGSVNIDSERTAPAVKAVPNSCEEPLSIKAEHTPVAGRTYEFAIRQVGGTWGAWQTSDTFTNLAGGVQYEVKLKDVQTGCESVSTPTMLLTKIKGEVKQTKLLGCVTGQEAVIEIKAEGGSGVYQYEVSGASTIARQDLPATPYNYTANTQGTYVIKLWDKDLSAAACPPLTFTVTVAPPVYPAFTASTVSATCNGASDGKILINEIATGAPAVTYTISSGAPYNPTIKGFEGLVAGPYMITALSTNGCQTTTNVVVGEPDAVNVAADFVTVKQFGCASGNTPESAVVTLDPTKVTGGTPPYSFTITYNGQTVNGTQLITNDYTGGTVTINVTDANGCTTIAPITRTIDKFDAITKVDITVTQDMSCKVNENIDISVTTVNTAVASINNPKIRYIQSATVPTTAPSTWTITTGTFTGLTPGTYTFWVGHIDTGCMTSVTHVVKEPNTFVIDPPVVTPAKCKGDAGSAVFNIHDATYAGQYDWVVVGTPAVSGNRIGSGPITVNIGAGTHILRVTQVSFPECSKEYPFTITEPDAALTANHTVKPITCAGNDGTIEVINVAGGWGDYKYSITPDPNAVGQTTNPLFINLPPNTYKITVTDKEGCVFEIQNIVLANPAPIVPVLTIDTQNCTEGTGVIKATASGGEGKNYTFQLIKDGAPYGAPVPGDAANSATFTNLSAGVYTVQVTDTWSCQGTSAVSATLYQPITNPSVTIDKEITCTATPHTGADITITHQGGNSGNINYVVTPPAGGAPITQNNNPVFTNLTVPGVYNVTITDVATGCAPVTAIFELTPTVAVAFTHTQTNVSCNGGDNGGFAITLDNTQTQLDYRIEVTSTVVGFTTQIQTVTTVPATHHFNNLKAGAYQVKVISARGCEAIQTITITEPAVLTATAAVVTEFACDASNTSQQAVVQATPQGGTSPYHYSIDGVDFSDTTGIFNIVDTGAVQNITITVRDTNGCQTTAQVQLNPLPKITDVKADPIKTLTCANDEEVRITVTGGANNGYQIDVTTAMTGATITPPSQVLAAGVNTFDFKLSKAGQYEFKVTDLVTKCSSTIVYEVRPYEEMKVTASPNKNVSCFTSADGEIKLETVNYIGSYTWEVLDAATLTPLTPAKTGTANATVFGSPVVTTITGLSAGDYVVQVKQTATPFCTINSTLVHIAKPTAALTVSATLANPLTCQGNDAIINVEAEGGWGDYQYRLLKNGAPHPVYGAYATVVTFANLDAGNYRVEVKDKEGCEAFADVLLSNPTPIVVGITPSTLNLTCFGDKTASITASVMPAGAGSGNYKYILLTKTASGIIESGAQDSPTFTGLGAGEYAVRVVDGWGCDAESAYIQIVEPLQVRVEAAITRRLSCLQQAQITLTGTGGSGTGYVFAVDPSSTGTIVQTAPGVYEAGPGTYVFTAVDSNNCPSGLSNTIVILPIEALGLNIDTTLAYVKCNGDSSATIKAEAYGGLGDYTYELLDATRNPFAPPVTNTNGVFGGLPKGTYNVKVTSDDCEHITRVPIVIDEAPALVFTTATSTNETCFEKKDGTIDVQAAGGTGAITYAISPRLDRVVTAEYIRNQKFEPGTYVVIAQDENGCTIEHQFVITAATKIDVTLVSTTDETCLGSADGTATITITGGVAPYRTSFNDNSNTANWVQGKLFYDNLPAGENHVIFVRDANDCETYVIIPQIKPGVDLQLSAEAQPQCSNNNVIENRVVVSVNPLYASQVTYVLDGGTPQRSNIFTGVTPGLHTITVTHSGGCVKETTVNMPNYSPLAVVTATTEITCHGANDGIISFQVTGGTSSYTYTITPMAGNFDAATGRFINLPPNNYTVTVRDNVLGCVVSEQFRFIDPALLSVDASTVSETCYGDNDGQISFEIKGGRPTYSYVLTNAQGQQIDAANAVAAGQVINRTGLVPGSYTLTYGDAGGVCTQTHTLVVGAAPNLKPVNDLEVRYECATSIPSNYLEVVFDSMLFNQANVFYALNSTNIADARRFTEFNGNVGIIRNLPVGSDQYITIFYNSCSYTIPVSQYFDVEDYQPLTLQNISDPRQMNQIKVQASGGKPAYRYYFNGKLSDDGDTYYVSANDPGRTDANGRVIKQVEVMVIDALGCTRTLTIEKEFIDIRIPNYFTPNGDGNNDGWAPENTRSYPHIEIFIYDRYGRHLAKLRQGEKWDGKYNQRDLPTGDYWYLVKLNGEGDDGREFIGNFTLFR